MKTHKRRRIDTNHLMIVIGTLVLILAVCISGVVWIIQNHSRDDYAAYRTYDHKNKMSGKLATYQYDKEDTFQQFYYPEFKQPKLNSQITSIVKEYQNNSKKPGIYTLDYASSELWKQYIQIVFTYKQYDKNEKLLNTKTERICFDMKTGQPLQLSDVLRSDYLTAIQRASTKGNVDLNQFSLSESGIDFYQQNKQLLHFPFAGNERFMNFDNPYVKGLRGEEPTKRPDQQPIDPNRPMIALTFDDGPNPLSTPKVLDTLNKYHATGTFFMLGNRAIQNPDLIRRMVKEGHELGNHSNTHANLSKLNEIQIKDEFYITQDAIYAATGEEATAFRPPYGAITPTMSQLLNREIMLWTIDTLDWKSRNADAIKNIVLSQVKNGAIILMHDIYGTTADALEQMMPVLVEKGYQFVSVSDLMKYQHDSK